MSEPCKFEPVKLPNELHGLLFMVARPGRGTCGCDGQVSEDAIRSWIEGVWNKISSLSARAKEPVRVDYVCLLGQKGDSGRREISDFYPARQREDPEDSTKPTFEELLNRLASSQMSFQLHHFPTVDGRTVPSERTEDVRRCVRELLAKGHTVLLGCSSAVGRTGAVLGDKAWLKSPG